MDNTPNPAVSTRLDAWIDARLAMHSTANDVCLFLQAMLGKIIKDTTDEVVWPEGRDFSRRVVVREDGITVGNFLAEVQHSYGDTAYELVVTALNSSQLAAWLDRQSASK